VPLRDLFIPRPDPQSLSEGRVVWITGASSGIGRAVALACAARGDRLVLSSRAEEVLDDVRALCEEAGAAAVLLAPLDIRDDAAVQAVADRAVATFGRLDVVVQNAGVVAYGRVEEVPLEVFDGVIATNVLGAARVCRAAIRVFRKQEHGTLVVVSSLLGKVAVPWMGAYVTSKFALQGLVRVMQQENRDLRDVKVTAVLPGGVDTPIYDQAATVMGQRNRPPSPVVSPEDVAAKVLHAVEAPHRHLSAGWGNPFMLAGFTFFPAVFDAAVGPALKLIGFTRRTRPNGSGNVLHAQPELERLRQDRGRKR